MSKLLDVAKRSLKNRFTNYKETEEQLDEALGAEIAVYTDWDGVRILNIAYAALEDANFHEVNETIAQLIEGLKK